MRSLLEVSQPITGSNDHPDFLTFDLNVTELSHSSSVVYTLGWVKHTTLFTDFMTASTISCPSPGALGRNVSCSRLGSGPGIPSGVDVSNSDKQLTGSPSWAKNQPKSDHGRGRKILSGAVTLSLPRLSCGMFLEYEWESSVPGKLTHRKWETPSVSPGPSVINKSAASARLHRCSQLFWLDLCSGWSVQSRADDGLKMIRKCSDSWLELQQIN